MTIASHSPLAATLISLVSVQVGAAVAKTLFPQVGPEGVAALRLGLASLVLVLWLRPWQLSLARSNWLALLGYGTVMALMNLLIYRAFDYIPVGIAISIEVLGPLGVALLTSRRRLDVLWVCFALAGVALLPLGSLNASLDLRGVGYAALAGLFWGLYVMVGKKTAPLGARGVALGMSMAALLVVPLGVAHAGVRLLTPEVLLIGGLVAVLSSAMPFLLDMYALKHLPRQVFGVLMSASPAVSALAGQWILGEQLQLLQWLGIGAISLACLGSALATHTGLRQDS
jgi:inner membrane transporter RhtA